MPNPKVRKNIMYKVITAGEGGVGKTTLLHKFVEGKFKIDTKMTIGVGFFLKDITLENGKTYSLQLWDFGGQELFRPFLDSYALGANGAILMFDLTRMDTLKR
ncbi:MAG: Rab family GTPase, partial [Promethearchaeota archaeon]